MSGVGVIIIGAGGHAAVVADALLAAGQQVIGFVDNDAARRGQSVCGRPVLGDDTALASFDTTNVRLANGIGGTRGEGLRAAVQRRLEGAGWHFVTVRHPSAVASPFAQLGAGVQLMAHSVVQPGARIGAGCIVNSAAVVEHDVQLGPYVHVACNATLCGGVSVGAGSHVGAAAVVRQGVRLGDATVVGAGAVVVNNFLGGGTLVGVPARPLHSKRSA
jgi:sugar O-acyltransferase (sialic acid O-acetyltransferase NeuD family)